jgi:tRNA pseudouridine55 synthase
MALEKEYMARVSFGGETDTLDVTGRVVLTCAVPHFSPTQLENACSRFLGEIDQIPPTFSAIRVKGKRAYQLARAGQVIPLKSRRVQIHELEISSKSDTECDMRVVCSKGTYIRSLARDIARTLGTAGYVKKLTRTRIGHYKISSSLELSDLAARLKNSGGYESILGHR